MRRGVATAALAAFAALTIAAPSALASTARIDRGVLKYAGAPGEANHLRIYYDVSKLAYVFEDTGVASITATAPGCTSSSPQVVTCAGTFTTVNVQLGDGGSYAADELTITPVTIHAGAGTDTIVGGGGTVTLIGGGGRDTLTAGSGETHLVGGPGGATMNAGSGHTTYQGGGGADTIHARNGVAESITCGPGIDSVDADTSDTVAPDCEHITRGTAAAPGAPSPTGPGSLGATAGSSPSKPPLVAISTAPVQLDSQGRVPVLLDCPPAAAGGCSGWVTLALPAPALGRAKAGMARRRRIVIGRAHFSLRAGAKTVVPVALSRRSARIFRTRGKRRSVRRVVVTVEVRTEAGSSRTAHTIVVRAARRSALAPSLPLT